MSGIPWDDKSGNNLRSWLGVTSEEFYNPDLFGIIPMGFCYPGKGKTGDKPPLKECAPKWHDKIFKTFDDVKLIVLIGKYAQDFYLKDNKKRNLTDTVKDFEAYFPAKFVLPHPSPRNNIWMAKNEWFKKDILPILKIHIDSLIR